VTEENVGSGEIKPLCPAARNDMGSSSSEKSSPLSYDHDPKLSIQNQEIGYFAGQAALHVFSGLKEPESSFSGSRRKLRTGNQKPDVLVPIKISAKKLNQLVRDFFCSIRERTAGNQMIGQIHFR
jgi:hypothetical protein